MSIKQASLAFALIWALVTPGANAPAQERIPKPRTIRAFGYSWLIISQSQERGPGPNVFDGRNVYLDGNGNIVLRTSYDVEAAPGGTGQGRWTSAHILLKNSLGYGRYELKLAPMEKALDRQAVFGFFTWDDDPTFANREIDIEIARWGQSVAPNLNFAVQPAEARPERALSLEFDFSRGATLSFTWTPQYVDFDVLSPTA